MRLFRLAMIALIATLSATNAGADITVKVMKGGTAPYLYAWDANQNPINGAWPGTQLTEKDADGYWTTTIATSLTQINMQMNMGSDAHKTGDYLNLTGVNGVIKLQYDGNKTMFGTMPAATYQAGKVAYFVCPPTWTADDIYSQIKHNDYQEEHKMTRIGTDGMGLDIYADYNFTSWSNTPQYIHFYDKNGNYCEYMTYSTGGYYNTEKAVANFVELTAANGYTDENFRKAIASFTGTEGAFCPNSITYLDVSGYGIASLAGISTFNNLQTLIAADNALTTSTVNLSSNTLLEVLNLSGNSGISKVDVAALTGLQYLDISKCDINDNQTFAPQNAHNSLTYLDISENPTSKGFSWNITYPILRRSKRLMPTSGPTDSKVHTLPA